MLNIYHQHLDMTDRFIDRLDFPDTFRVRWEDTTEAHVVYCMSDKYKTHRVWWLPTPPLLQGYIWRKSICQKGHWEQMAAAYCRINILPKIKQKHTVKKHKNNTTPSQVFIFEWRRRRRRRRRREKTNLLQMESDTSSSLRIMGPCFIFLVLASIHDNSCFDRMCIWHCTASWCEQCLN